MPESGFAQSIANIAPLPPIFRVFQEHSRPSKNTTDKTNKAKLDPRYNQLNQTSSIDPAAKRLANELRQQGLSYRQQQRLPEAISVLEQAAQLDPEAIDGWIILGWTQHLNRQPLAAASLWQAIYRRPTATEAFNAIGIVYLVRGELPQAALLHSWAALLKTDNEIAHYNLNLTYQRQQQFDLALAHGALAVSLEPTNPHPLVALAITYWFKGDQAQAKQAYQGALRLDGRYQSSEFLDHLTEAGFDLTQVQQARQVLALVR